MLHNFWIFLQLSNIFISFAAGSGMSHELIKNIILSTVISLLFVIVVVLCFFKRRKFNLNLFFRFKIFSNLYKYAKFSYVFFLL